MISVASSIVASKILYPELILKSISSLSSVSIKLIDSVRYVNSISHNDTELDDILNKSDIEQDIIIIKSFIEEEHNRDISPTILNCINNLNESLLELDKHFTELTKKIEYNKTVWFSYIRAYDISHEKKEIPILFEKLKHRFDILIKISSVLKN